MQIKDARGKGLKYITVRIATGHDSSDQAWDSRLSEDDAGGVTAFPGNVLVSNQSHGGARNTGLEGCTLHVNVREPNAAYKAKSVFYPPLAGSTADHLKDPLNDPSANIDPVIVLEDAGSGPPPSTGLSRVDCLYNGSVKGDGTPAEWKAIAHQIVATKLPADAIMEADTGPQPNLQLFNAELKKVHPRCELQRSSGGTLKPRIFLPSDNQDGSGPPESMCGQYSRPVDIGSFGFKFFHNSHSSDEWNLTGRPPSSKW